MRFHDIINQVDESGYCVLSNISEEGFQQFVLSSGNVQVDLRSPDLIRDIRPQSTFRAMPNTLSSRYGLQCFPFHTDVAHWEHPARYLLLYCERPGSGLRPTHLQDSYRWMLEPDEKQAMLRDVWKCGHAHPRLCTLATMNAQQFALRFDQACMSPL